MSNNATIRNLYGGTTIISGGALSMKNNAQTILASGVSSSSSGFKSDIVQNNASLKGLSDTNFQNTYAGMALTSFQSSANTKLTGSGSQNYSSQLSGKKGQIIYINQGSSGTVTVSNNITMGSSSSPIIIVVIGNVNFSNNVTLNGSVYATGNITLGNNTTMNGYVFALGNISLSNNAIVNGATAAGGTTTAASNNAAINYNPTNLSNVNGLMGGTDYGKIGGSWQDMNL